MLHMRKIYELKICKLGQTSFLYFRVHIIYDMYMHNIYHVILCSNRFYDHPILTILRKKKCNTLRSSQ